MKITDVKQFVGQLRYDLNDVNLLKTLSAFLFSNGKRILIYPNVHFAFEKTTSFRGEGLLRLGVQWDKGRYFPSQMVLRNNARLNIERSFKIYSDFQIWINDAAIVSLGSGYINNGLRMSCFQNIEIGHQVRISENVTIRDSDNHVIGQRIGKPSSVKIGDHVWIGMNVTILKGVTIGNGAVVAAGAVVNRDIPDNCLAAGVPAQIKKTDITWHGFSKTED
jgi:acetyltransferase-like isoleucine patch superfamily enzyme